MRQDCYAASHPAQHTDHLCVCTVVILPRKIIYKAPCTQTNILVCVRVRACVRVCLMMMIIIIMVLLLLLMMMMTNVDKAIYCYYSLRRRRWWWYWQVYCDIYGLTITIPNCRNAAHTDRCDEFGRMCPTRVTHIRSDKANISIRKINK